MIPPTLASIAEDFIRSGHPGRGAVVLAAEERILFLEKLIMSKEARIINHQAAEIADLRKQLDAVPPPVDPATIKDAEDLTAEAGFNEDGTEKVAPPPPPPEVPAPVDVAPPAAPPQ